MNAAATAKRRAGDAIAITVFERSARPSYSACGIPYWVGGAVASGGALVARTPEEHRRRGIDVRTGSTVIALDPARRSLEVRDGDGTASSHDYDSLLIATGAEPIRPDLPGIMGNGIHGIQTLDDGAEILNTMARASPCGGGGQRLHRPGNGRSLRSKGCGHDSRRSRRDSTPTWSMPNWASRCAPP